MIKRLPGWPNGCYPDLILHKRGNNENNILIIECKGWWSSEEAIQNDREKIMQFLHSEKISIFVWSPNHILQGRYGVKMDLTGSTENDLQNREQQ